MAARAPVLFLAATFFARAGIAVRAAPHFTAKRFFVAFTHIEISVSIC